MSERTTPLPWRVESYIGSNFQTHEYAIRASTDKPYDIIQGLSEADATLIVKRVNAGPAADTLAEAARDAVRRAEWFVGGHSWPEPFMTEAMNAERAFERFKEADARLLQSIGGDA